MKENELRAKLISAARNNPPSDHVPYAFEKRIMSRLGEGHPNVWAIWAGPLWRAAISCVAITILCGVWFLATHPQKESSDNFSQDFEAAVFAPVSQHLEDAW